MTSSYVRRVASLALAVVPAVALAFHSGGVGECEGCHSMHNSYEGQPNVTGMPLYQSGPYLLKARDQSGACLNCHAGPTRSSYHVDTTGVAPYDGTTPQNLTPGGDFAWLKKTMNGTIRGSPVTWEGERRGHNVIAVDFGYPQDGTHVFAPGDAYPASVLHCSSCHDPHGRYRRFADGTIATTGLPIFNSGSYTTSNAPVAGVSAVGTYRLLGGVGYQPKSISGSHAFVAGPPSAVAPASYNGPNTTLEGTFDRVAYGSGFSEWCSNCHVAIHQDTYTSGASGLRHPAGNGAKFTAEVAGIYVAYVTSGVMTGTGAGYSALTPFETGNGHTLSDYEALKAFQAAPTAPTTASTVVCLSCHRSHASAFQSKTRYALGNEFMTIADASGAAVYDASTTENKINEGYDVAQQTAAYNGRPATLFGPYARSQCNKCHGKD